MSEDVRVRRLGVRSGGWGWTAGIAGAVLGGVPLLAAVGYQGAGLVILIGALIFIVLMALAFGLSVRAVVAWRQQGGPVPLLGLFGLVAVAALTAWTVWSLTSGGA